MWANRTVRAVRETFEDFRDRSGCEAFAGEWGMAVFADSVGPSYLPDLYDLDDYKVSNLSGGVYWLLRRGVYRGV
jgi:hypothetical protein